MQDAAPYVSKHLQKASKPHRHSFYQIIWFKSSGRHYIDYQVITHKANTVLFINPGQVHNFCHDSANEGYLFHFNSSFLAKQGQELLARFSISVFNEIAGNQVLLETSHIPRLESLINMMLEELEEQGANYTEMIYHHFLSTLLYLERIKTAQSDFDTNQNSDLSTVVAFKNLVATQLSESHNIDYYANQLGISAKKLTQLTKEFLQSTPALVIKEIKTLEAKRILSNQKVSIKEVAYQLGFDQPTYFTKFFKKEVGVTPKEFQQTIH